VCNGAAEESFAAGQGTSNSVKRIEQKENWERKKSK
jgi:hypothetical protein